MLQNCEHMYEYDPTFKNQRMKTCSYYKVKRVNAMHTFQ